MSQHSYLDHLASWCMGQAGEADGFELFTAMADFVSSHPWVVEQGRSWPEVRQMMEPETIKPLEVWEQNVRV